MRNTLAFILLLVLFFAASYCSTAGYAALRLELLASDPQATMFAPVIVGGIEFRNVLQARIHFGSQSLHTWASTVADLPHLSILLLTCICMGVLGTLIRILYRRVHDGVAYAELMVAGMALLGAAMGLLLFMVGWAVPDAIPITARKPLEYGLPVLAALGGLFTKETLERL